MKPNEVKIEWYNEMYYKVNPWGNSHGNDRRVAAEVMGSKVLYDKSPEYIAGFCQAKADQGFGVSIDNKPIHGLLT